jgi:xylan 1,4-beta-xylosidase
MLRPMGGVRRRVLVLAAVLAGAAALALVLLTGGSTEPERPRPPAPTAPPTATAPAPRPPVDVRAVANLGATPTPAPSMSGFLHSLAQATPPDSAISPLRPRLWRSVPDLAPPARAIRLGARYQLVLSDLWGYPGSGWNGKGPPWDDLAGWERTVRAAVRSVGGLPVEWDVWNEPDNPAFFTGTRDQYLRLYDVADRVLRRALGREVVVGGPSTTKARPEWLAGLLRHCRGTGCRVGFLSWHANLQPYERITSITDTLRRVRAQVLPRYRDVGLERLEVNESVGPADQYRPGEILGFLHSMEAGGAGAAARSCWPALDGTDNCRNGTLEGLLTPDGRPRSAWWAYRAYADGVDGRVPGRSSDPAVAVLAGGRAGSGGEAQVVLARLDRVHSGARPLEVELTLNGLARAPALAGARRVRVEVGLLPDSGEAPLPAPRPVSSQVVEAGASVPIRVGALRPHEALVVRIRPG